MKRPLVKSRHWLFGFLALFSAASLFADSGADHQVAQARPIQLGTSGGNINDRSSLYCCSGTLGSLVKDTNGILYILSNNHVLAKSNTGTIGDDISQPGAIDQNCAQNGVVADLSKFVQIKFVSGSTVPLNGADAAIAAIRSGAVRTDGSILDIGTISSATLNPVVGASVQKSGRTTGHTTGSISATDVTVDVGYSTTCGGSSTQKARYTNQFRITPGTFSAGGDSGSLITEAGTNPRAVGLLFAGSSDSTIAAPINGVLKPLGVSMVGGVTQPPATGSVAGTVASTLGGGIGGATVRADTGVSTTTAPDGSYTLANVAIGTRTVTASASGFTSSSQTASVTSNAVTTVDFALSPVVTATKSIAQCVTYSTSGGKGGKDLSVKIRVLDDLGNPVSGAAVNISLTLNGSAYATGTGATTTSSGDATYNARSAPNGTYVTTVTAINKTGLSFEGSTPANSFRKGIDPSPSSFCRTTTLAADTTSAETADPKFDHARNVKSEHSEALLKTPGVVGHGLSADEHGQPVIEIYLDNAGAGAGVPEKLDDIPVRKVVTGPFTAF